jgi:CBS domain-containing protein
VVSTRLNRCIVVDRERRVKGKVTDAEVLERVTPALRPSALRSLIHRLPFVHPTPDEARAEQHATARTAADLMIETAIVREDAPLREAIASVLEGRHKIAAVVDAEQRLVGCLDRADLLRGLLSRSLRGLMRDQAAGGDEAVGIPAWATEGRLFACLAMTTSNPRSAFAERGLGTMPVSLPRPPGAEAPGYAYEAG